MQQFAHGRANGRHFGFALGQAPLVLSLNEWIITDGG
jgi:hypothetical protein